MWCLQALSLVTKPRLLDSFVVAAGWWMKRLFSLWEMPAGSCKETRQVCRQKINKQVVQATLKMYPLTNLLTRDCCYCPRCRNEFLHCLLDFQGHQLSSLVVLFVDFLFDYIQQTELTASSCTVLPVTNVDCARNGLMYLFVIQVTEAGLPVVLKFLKFLSQLSCNQQLSWNLTHLIRMSWYGPLLCCRYSF